MVQWLQHLDHPPLLCPVFQQEATLELEQLGSEQALTRDASTTDSDPTLLRHSTGPCQASYELRNRNDHETPAPGPRGGEVPPGKGSFGREWADGITQGREVTLRVTLGM